MSLLSLWITLGLTSASGPCLEADRVLLDELGFSAPTAQKLCTDRRNMEKIRKAARKNPASAKAAKVYRGIAIHPKDYVANRNMSFRGVYVDRIAWRAPLSYSTGAFGIRDPSQKIGTLVEYEVPEYVLRPMKGTYILDESRLPRGAKDFPLYTTRIAEVDVASAIRAKSNGTHYQEIIACTTNGVRKLFGVTPLLKWKTF